MSARTSRMGRPSASPTLAEVHPAAWAQSVVDIVRRHVTHMTTTLGIPAIDDLAVTDLHHTAADLVRYAQGGLPATQWDQDDADAALRSVTSALYSRAVDEGSGWHPDPTRTPSDSDTRDRVGLVLLAASARASLARGHAPAVQELAALAGVTPHHVRHQIREGELPALPATRGLPTRVRSTRAIPWLEGRGVKGL